MARRNQQLQREEGRQEPWQRFLIYCEGKRTEKSYFKGIKNELRTATVQIEIGPVHGEPRRLVEAAIDHQRQAPRSPRDHGQAYNQVWCVFDVEAPESRKRLDEVIQFARRNSVRCAVSNPCFELWLLLHFRDPPGYLTNETAGKLLENYHCGYSRRAKEVDYDLVRDKRLDARDRAIRLDKRDRGTRIDQRNPWTSVHELVDALFDEAYRQREESGSGVEDQISRRRSVTRRA